MALCKDSPKCYAGIPGAKNDRASPEGRPRQLVEAAGIEPASASPPLRALHAYSVFDLIAGYPTGREDLKPAQ